MYAPTTISTIATIKTILGEIGISVTSAAVANSQSFNAPANSSNKAADMARILNELLRVIGCDVIPEILQVKAVPSINNFAAIVSIHVAYGAMAECKKNRWLSNLIIRGGGGEGKDFVRKHEDCF